MIYLICIFYSSIGIVCLHRVTHPIKYSYLIEMICAVIRFHVFCIPFLKFIHKYTVKAHQLITGSKRIILIIIIIECLEMFEISDKIINFITIRHGKL